MKTNISGLIASLLKTSLRRCALPLALLLGPALPAAVTFTITPSQVFNNFARTISLAITGLTNTETVVIQKFLDLNTNGIIDGDDWLVQQFALQDGTNLVIGGVTNLNVPGDFNATAGAITATFNSQGGDFVQNICGKYLYELSSPVGHFAPITNQFVVLDFFYTQQFAGNVVSNRTSTTVSNAVVLLFPPPRPGHNGPIGSPVAGTVANNAGHYIVTAPPGKYSLVAFKTNYVVDLNTAPVLTLAPNLTVNTNLSLTDAIQSISGRLVDTNDQTIGLPGVLVPAVSANGQMAITFTDTNGGFNVPVTPGTWGIKADDIALMIHSYVGWRSGTNVAAGTAGLILPVPMANALIYGNVKDNAGSNLWILDISAKDSPGHNWYETDGFTGTNGNYVLGVLGAGANDPWSAEGNMDNMRTNYVFSPATFDGNIGAGQAVLQNFTAILATNHITGNLQDNKGNNLAGVAMSVSALVNGTNYQARTLTDANGNYSLYAPNGNWLFGVNCFGSDESLESVLGRGNFVCPDGQNVNFPGTNTTVNFIVQVCDSISIVTASPLPLGEVNAHYDQFLQASSCNPVFTWSVTSGSLPPGLTADPVSGEISGTPTGSGTFTFTVQVGDSFNTTNKDFSLAITNALQITTTSLPDGTNASGTNSFFYSQTLLAAGGVPFGGVSPYRWTVLSGSLPANLTLATNGLLSGLPATTGGFNFTVEAADQLGVVSDQELSLNIVPKYLPPLTVGTGGGQMIVFWPLSGGANCQLQMTTNLADGPWVPATSGVPAISFVFTNNPPAVFFRLQ